MTDEQHPLEDDEKDEGAPRVRVTMRANVVFTRQELLDEMERMRATDSVENMRKFLFGPNSYTESRDDRTRTENKQ